MSRHFLLDGYNILRQMPGNDTLSLEDGRRHLIRFIQDARPQGSARNSVTLVFDGQEGICFPDFSSGVQVIFSKGESADDVIKRLVEDSLSARDIILVTDDRDLLYFCRTLGAGIWSVAQFLAQGRKTKERLCARTGREGASGKDGKNISCTVEARVNRELRDLWLKGKK